MYTNPYIMPYLFPVVMTVVTTSVVYHEAKATKVATTNPYLMPYLLRSRPRLRPSSSCSPKAVTWRKTSMMDRPSLTILPGGTASDGFASSSLAVRM